MDKKYLISELERYIDFIDKTKLTLDDGIAGVGHKDFDKYPKGTPGIHPYWDTEIFQEVEAGELLRWYKYGELPTPTVNPSTYKYYYPILDGKNIKYRINYVNYLILNPKYDTLVVPRVQRGPEILLALAARNNWKKIFCFDHNPVYEKLIKEFFNDDRISFSQFTTSGVSSNLPAFDEESIKEDNIAMPLPRVFSHKIFKKYLQSKKNILLIYNGILLFKGDEFKSELPDLDFVFNDLQNKMDNNNGV